MRRFGLTLVALCATAALLPAVPASAAGLAKPALQTPAAGASVQALPAFTWGNVKGAEQYEVQVAADQRFGSIVTARSVKTVNTAFTVPEAVANGEYFWRVRAIDADGKAGPWAGTRNVTKDWNLTPQLLAPDGVLPVYYPAEPLVLRWGDVDGAYRYIVTVASDPTLAQSVIGSKTVETAGTVFALPGALSAGTYHWAVQPVDARGHKGARSAVGKFTWGWKSDLTMNAPKEMRSAARVGGGAVSDPELSWTRVPGASGYEVQINFTDSFAAGSMVESATTIGTRYSPKAVLSNNTYHWRVRPLDVNGNPTGWLPSQSFVKSFDTLAPTVPGLHVSDNLGQSHKSSAEVPAVKHPLFEWEPVSGASGYEIQTAEQKTVGQSKFCDWAGARWARTPNTAWSPIVRPDVAAPGASSRGLPILDTPELHEPKFTNGVAYCVRVMAIADFSYTPTQDDVLSDWTYVHNGAGAPAGNVSTNSNAPAFVYVKPDQLAAVGDPAQDAAMNQDDYLSPASPASLKETPVLRWKPVPGAKGYWVIIGRDPQLTNVRDVAFVHQPQHAPRTTLRDETTEYFWGVLPSFGDDGSLVPTDVTDENRRQFSKSSDPAELFEVVVDGQPTFHWSEVLGAKSYRLQVSTDPNFKDSDKELDRIDTASTAYTPTKTYPVDTELFWQVTARAAVRIDDGDVTRKEAFLNPSRRGSFRRKLPVPVPAADNAQGGLAIPALRWSPVDGAVGYDVHVDQADGTRKDFSVKAAAFTPSTWYGTGVWSWQVRAVFPGDTHGAYSPSIPFARFIPAPPKARAERTKDRVVIAWEGLRNVERYKVEISADSSFGKIVERGNVDGTAFAPELDAIGYRSGGTLHWRVAAVDEGNNIGAFATGTLTLARRLSVRGFGAPRSRRTNLVRVTVADLGRKRIKGAKVVISGLGVKVTRKSGKDGRVLVRIRPRRKGNLTIKATKKGFSPATTKLRVR